MKKFNFFELTEKPTLHVGRRITKTVTAVFICALIGYFRGTDSAIVSMIAAVICIQPTRDESVTFAANRVIGTILGGLLGAGCLFLARITGLIGIAPLYYLFISVMLIPLILLTLLMRKPSISAFSCIVFLMVTVTVVEGASPITYSIERTLETLIGIVAGLGVNRFFPRSKKEREADKASKACKAADNNRTN